MTDLRTELATLIASRICHDLISPVGAISNGLELLQLGGDIGVGSPEMQLITESCENANARIRFLRVAYGAASDTMQVATSEVESILAALNKGSRLAARWESPGDVSRASVQLAFLALQCAETAMRRGGEVIIRVTDDTISLTAHSDHMTIDPDLWDHIEGGTPSPTTVLGKGSGIAPAQVQFLLLPLLAADRGRKLRMHHDANALTIEM